MKTFKKFVFGAIIALPLFLAPARSQAGIISELLHEIFGNHDHKGQKADPPAGNSVPVNGGLILLMVAGLGLGSKIMFDKNKKLVEPATI